VLLSIFAGPQGAGTVFQRRKEKMEIGRFFEKIRKFKSNSKYKRNLRILLITGAFGFLFVGVLVVWAGVEGFNYIISATESVNISEKMPATILSPQCWSKAQSLLHLQVWLDKPALENLVGLKNVCLGEASGLGHVPSHRSNSPAEY